MKSFFDSYWKMIRFKICFFHSNYILVSLFVGIIYETSLQKSSDCWSKKQETIHRATSFDFRSLEQRVEAKSRRGNSDYELCKIKWNGGDKAKRERERVIPTQGNSLFQSELFKWQNFLNIECLLLCNNNII